MRTFCILTALLIVTALFAAGCGETFNGMSKDTRRMGKGIKTIFVRED